jgi:prophage DNA circulation protein
MSKFDFNSPVDFAKATMSAVPGELFDLEALLQGRDPAAWDIKEASYNGVLFHVFTSKSEYQAGLSSIQDSGGRRKVFYQFPYQDGQTSDDLGRKPETFQMDVLIHGQRYMTGLRKLIAEFQKPQPGILVHPVQGELRVVVTDYQLGHKYDSRKAVELRVTFAEHNFAVSALTIQKDRSLFGALSDALSAFDAIEATITKISGYVGAARSTINRALTRYRTIKAAYARLLSSINTSFNGSQAQNIPALLPVNQGGVLNSDGTFATDIFRTAADALSETTAQALAVEQLTKDTQAVRDEISLGIEDLKALNALDFHDDIVSSRRTAVLAQEALEAAIAASQPRVILYTTPRLMSIREIAFENGVPITRVSDLDLLNPQLESVNFIPAGTQVKVSLA